MIHFEKCPFRSQGKIKWKRYDLIQLQHINPKKITLR